MTLGDTADLVSRGPWWAMPAAFVFAFSFMAFCGWVAEKIDNFRNPWPGTKRWKKKNPEGAVGITKQKIEKIDRWKKALGKTKKMELYFHVLFFRTGNSTPASPGVERIPDCIKSDLIAACEKAIEHFNKELEELSLTVKD